MLLYHDDQIFIDLEASFPIINLRITSGNDTFVDALAMQKAEHARAFGVSPADRLRALMDGGDLS